MAQEVKAYIVTISDRTLTKQIQDSYKKLGITNMSLLEEIGILTFSYAGSKKDLELKGVVVEEEGIVHHC